MISEQKLRAALDAEYANAEPPTALWERVKPAIPARAPRRRLSRLAAAAIWALVVMIGGVAVAASPQVQAMIDKYFERTGVRLVESPPPAPGSGTKLQPNYDNAQLSGLVPEGMKLPTYLPAPLNGPDAKVAVNDGDASFGVLWVIPGHPETGYLALSRHKQVYGGEATYGALHEVQDITIGDLKTSAFRDDLGWRIVWLVDGTEYLLQATNLPLSEAVKVAESLK